MIQDADYVVASLNNDRDDEHQNTFWIHQKILHRLFLLVHIDQHQQRLTNHNQKPCPLILRAPQKFNKKYLEIHNEVSP